MTLAGILAVLGQASGTPSQLRGVLESSIRQVSDAEGMPLKMAAGVALAEELHAGQYRYDGSPYVVHPLRVAVLYVESSDEACEERYVLVSLLHDVLEDTSLTFNELVKAMGLGVASEVERLSAAPDKERGSESPDDRRRRKLAKWERVADGSKPLRRVHCCDVLDNLLALRHLKGGDVSEAKIARWLMQAETYHLPIARSVDRALMGAIEHELQFQLSSGREIGSWLDD